MCDLSLCLNLLKKKKRQNPFMRHTPGPDATDELDFVGATVACGDVRLQRAHRSGRYSTTSEVTHLVFFCVLQMMHPYRQQRGGFQFFFLHPET